MNMIDIEAMAFVIACERDAKLTNAVRSDELRRRAQKTDRGGLWHWLFVCERSPAPAN